MKSRILGILAWCAICSAVNFSQLKLSWGKGMWRAPETVQDKQADSAAVSNDVKRLPFPPDTTGLEFDSTFKEIEFTSQSSLMSLAAFYRAELASRGWSEDAEAVEEDEEHIEMAFRAGKAVIEMDLDLRSDDTVHVQMDTEGLQWTGVNDPGALLAAGIPQPRAFVFLQENLPPPPDSFDIQYEGDGYRFKSPLNKQACFESFIAAAKRLGFNESRRRIESDNRRYTEFQRGPTKVNINIFDLDKGCRGVISYEDPSPERQRESLPAVASSNRPLKPKTADRVAAEAESEMENVAESPQKPKQPVTIASDKGSATLWYGSDKYELQHVAAYRNDYFETSVLIFADRKIPKNRLQDSLYKSDDPPSFFELFDFDVPNYLILDIPESSESESNISLTLSVPGVGIGGHSLDQVQRNIKLENGRVSGTISMEPEKILSQPVRFEATIDAIVLSKSTALADAPPDELASPPATTVSGFPFPKENSGVTSEGSRYRKVAETEAEISLADAVAFYRQEMTDQNWEELPGEASPRIEPTILKFKGESGTSTVTLTAADKATKIQVELQNVAAARADGILPEDGKARLILGNASSQDIVITIGKNDYPVKAGQGSDDPRQALNYSVAPGTYRLSIKVPGQPPRTEELSIAAGTAWGVLALPTGETFADRLY